MFHGMEYVYEVYKERSFSKAAKNLYISQPALSATIKKIETRIGISIFDRSTNPIKLTDYGKEYIRSIEKIMDIENSFNHYIHNVEKLKFGSLTIGTSSLFASYLLPPMIAKFKLLYPLVKVDLIETIPFQLEKGLLDNSLHLVIENDEFDEAICDKYFTKMLFFNEHLILAAHKRFSSNHKAEQYQLTFEDISRGRHLDASTPAVPLEIFKADPFVLLRPGYETRTRIDKIFKDKGLEPAIVLEVVQLISAYNIACYGMGLTFISDTLVTRTKPDPEIIYYKVDAPETVRDVSIFCKRNKYITQTMEEFIRLSLLTALNRCICNFCSFSSNL